MMFLYIKIFIHISGVKITTLIFPTDVNNDNHTKIIDFCFAFCEIIA